VSISGNLRTMPFADLLQWVSQSRKTGTLAVEGPEHNKKVYFRDGLVVASSSENPKEYLGYYLVGWNYISEEELQELLDMQDRHGTLLGELLVIIGRISREDLTRILQVKTEETIYELFLWEEGDFRFLENILPAKKFQPLGLAIDMLTLEGVRRKDEWLRIRDSIPDPQWIPKLIRAVDVQQIGATELGILGEINGRNSIEEISLACRLPMFHTLHFIFSGAEAGLFELRPPTTTEIVIPGFSQGAWRVLLKEAERAIAAGNLLRAWQQLREIRERHAQQREANEQATGIEHKILQELERRQLDDNSILELAVPPAALFSLECSPEEGFLLSRINGAYTVREIVRQMPGSEVETRLMVESLLRRRALRVKDDKTGSRDLRAG
jgi:hypothetical protein